MDNVTKTFLVMVLLLGAAYSAQAGEKVGDFAYAYPILYSEEAPFYEVILPKTIYLTLTHPDFRDVRIFNRDNLSVPFLLRRPKNEIQPPLTVPIGFFPLSKRDVDVKGGLNVKIKQGERGVIVKIRGQVQTDGRRSGTIREYILDLSALKGPASELLLDWDREEGLWTTATLTGSNDLKSWYPVVADSPLVDLRRGEDKLRVSRIVLPSTGATYLRLTWPKDDEVPKLRSVSAVVPQAAKLPDREWLDVSPAEVKKADLYFSHPAYFPADQLRVISEQKNFAFRAELQSRSDSASDWTTRFRGVITNIATSAGRPGNEIDLIQPVRDRNWRIFNYEFSGQMWVSFGYVPDRLVFLAQGQGPFLLAVGNASVKPENPEGAKTLLHLLNDKTKQDSLKPAKLGERQTLAGKAALTPPLLPHGWQQWIIWVVMVLILIGLGWLIRRLYKEINAGSKKD